MPTICPNCLHPVRMSATYCGFCGTSLIASANPESAVIPSSPPVEEDKKSAEITGKQQESRRMKTGRIVMIVVVIILCLIIIIALALNYWLTLNPPVG